MNSPHVITSYLPDNETVHSVAMVVNGYRKRNLPRTEDARAEIEDLLTKFDCHVDIYNAQAMSVAGDTDGICIVTIMANGNPVIHPLTMPFSINACEAARVQAQAAALMLRQHLSPNSSVATPAIGYSVRHPDQWSINDIVKVAKMRYRREYEGHPPHVQDDYNLHRPASALAVVVANGTLNITRAETDGQLTNRHYGAPNDDVPQLTKQCAKLAACGSST